MKSRTLRLVTIREIINNHKIKTQSELLNRLIASGFTCTQATLSRDLKFLKAGKIPAGSGEYIYALQSEMPNLKIKDTSTSYVKNGFISFEYASGLGVIKTLPAYASSLAMTIDLEESYEVAGTIAGDDTVLIIPRTGISETDLRNRLVVIFPELKDRIGHRS